MTQTTERLDKNIRIIGASAGTGKTSCLADEFLKAVKGIGYKEPIRADKIFVSTFTTKAADELASRIRECLIENTEWESAHLVLAGYVGTVNSICGKLLQDYALEAGMSPVQTVIPEQLEKVMFSLAVEPVLDSFAEDIDEIAARLSFDEPSGESKFAQSVYWTEFVSAICKYARANNIPANQFSTFAERSWQSLQPLLKMPADGLNPDELDEDLLRALEHSIVTIQNTNDSTKKTQSAIDKLREVLAQSKRGPLSWYDWGTLTKLEVSKASSGFVTELLEVACLHAAHPRLHEDLKQFIHLIFACAAEALDAYQEFKSAAGLVDFTDQEYRALTLLDDPNIAESLSSRITLALIDEFQDTSPIQLSLFLKLAKIAHQSIWVGDTKQAIYGFRGTDPQLMQAASKIFVNDLNRLDCSYRSRVQLVDFSNEVFRKAFGGFGFKDEEVVLNAYRKEISTAQPVVEIWNCNGPKLEECYKSFADAVSDLLARVPPLEVWERSSNSMRALRGSDIAILCRANDRCAGVAEALSQANLRVATERDGLLDTPECLLALATLRYLVDKSDRLALAQMIHLARDYSHSDQSAWLTDWLLQSDDPEMLLPYADDLRNAKALLPVSTTLEALQLALTAGRVLETVSTWGNTRQRFSNIDALRGLVRDYEDACVMNKSAASAAGFIAFSDKLRQAYQPASSDLDAVQVLTYHGSKGLEWPVVILTDLDKGSIPEVHKDLCGVHVEAGDRPFDPEQPLDGRWIRFWPWPYGRHEQGVYLDASATASHQYQETSKRLRSESVRLMYVGMTRARDLLILAPYMGRRGQGNGTAWLDHLIDKDGHAILTLPDSDDVGSITIGDTVHDVRVRTMNPPALSAGLNPTAHDSNFTYPVDRGVTHSPFLLKPSESLPSLTQATAAIHVPIVDIGARIPISGNADMEIIGECVHRFLAADDRNLSLNDRLAIADRLRELWSAPQLTSESLVEISDRLSTHINSTFGTCVWYRECPVIGRSGLQRIHGVIDLLLETDSAFYIVDHKSFPGSSDKWEAKAVSFHGQLLAYKQVLAQASTKPVAGLYIHMPIVGKILDLTNLPVLNLQQGS